MKSFNNYRDANAHAETLSNEKTTTVQCPRCQAEPGERCVTTKRKPASTHADRTERAVFMQEFHSSQHDRMMGQVAERKREARIAAGLTPEEHAPDCFCDEECWPRKQEESEMLIDFAKIQIDQYRQRLEEAQAELDTAMVNESRMAIGRDAWLRQKSSPS